MIIQAQAEQMKEMNLAKEVGELLHAHYPGHLWAIEVKGGVIIIKDLYISSLYGFVLKLADVGHDAEYRRKEVMRAGGELLERAGMKRGEYQAGQRVTALEGIKKYKPLMTP